MSCVIRQGRLCCSSLMIVYTRYGVGEFDQRCGTAVVDAGTQFKKLSRAASSDKFRTTCY